MLKIIKGVCSWPYQLRERNRQRRLLLDVYAEMKVNLERCYVMSQLGRLRLFDMAAWQSAAGRNDVLLMPAIKTYGDVLQEYNNVLQNFLDYEVWYGSAAAHKTRENGRSLHAKQQVAKRKFQTLLPVIQQAEKELRENMLAQRWVKRMPASRSR